MVKLLATKKEYEDAVNSGKTIVIDFFAEWCGPCKMISPFFDELEVGVQFQHINIICSSPLRVIEDKFSLTLLRWLP